MNSVLFCRMKRAEFGTEAAELQKWVVRSESYVKSEHQQAQQTCNGCILVQQTAGVLDASNVTPWSNDLRLHCQCIACVLVSGFRFERSCQAIRWLEAEGVCR